MNFIYSQLSSDSVFEIVNTYYDIGSLVSSKFYVQGLHDNYLVECNKMKYIYRIYRNDWRSEEEILFELDLLSHLEKTSSNVSFPIRMKNDKYVTYIKSPEGVRIGVLFQYAIGYPPSNDISSDLCNLLGISVANIHNNTEGFKSEYKRETLDLAYLVDHSLKLIHPFLNPGQVDYLNKIRELIYDNISHLAPDNSDFGICAGDINLTNFHISEDNIITHFDFDQCGYGFRAFELGKFAVGFRSDNLKKEKFFAFLSGYESIRKISEKEKMAIPYFEIVAVIWVMSIHASNVNKIGYQYLDESFWKKRIGIIESLDWVLDRA